MFQQLPVENDAARREFIRNCMRQKLGTQPATTPPATTPATPAPTTTPSAPASEGFSFASVPTHYWLIGAAALYFLTKKH